MPGPAGLFYRPFGNRLFAGVVPCIPVHPTIVGAAFFTAFAAAFVYAGDERLASVETLVIWGTPVVLALIAGNWNYWAWFQVCAIFFGYLWVFLIAIVGGIQSESPISQKSINYGLLLTSPVQLDYSFNQAWVGSQTSAFIMVGTGLALAIASVGQTTFRLRGLKRLVQRTQERVAPSTTAERATLIR